MAVPFYVSPDQIMQDKAEYARKGIAKGRSIVAVEYADGLLLMAENPSASLSKISEIYDRIAFAGVGKYTSSKTSAKLGYAMRISKAMPIAVRMSRPNRWRMPIQRPWAPSLPVILSRWKWRF